MFFRNFIDLIALINASMSMLNDEGLQPMSSELYAILQKVIEVITQNYYLQLSVVWPHHALLLKYSTGIVANFNTNAVGPHQYLSKLALSTFLCKSLASIAIDALVPLSKAFYLVFFSK